MDVYASCRKLVCCPSLIPSLSPLNAKDLFTFFLPFFPWLSNSALYFTHQMSHVSPFTWVMFEDNSLFQDLKKFWVPSKVKLTVVCIIL